MDGKIILLMMSVVAVGMFVLPSSLALYTGQHDFVSRTEVDCGKCHSESQDRIAAELYNGSVDGVDRVHYSLTCQDCHYGTSGTVGGNVNAVDVTGYGTNVSAHAAGVTVNCIDCHSYPLNYTASTKDSGPGLNNSINVSYELSLTGEAHKYLSVNLSASNGGIRDRDAACIGCHTRLTSYNFNGTDLDLGQASDTGTLYLTKNETESWMYEDRQ